MMQKDFSTIDDLIICPVLWHADGGFKGFNGLIGGGFTKGDHTSVAILQRPFPRIILNNPCDKQNIYYLCDIHFCLNLSIRWHYINIPFERITCRRFCDLKFCRPSVQQALNSITRHRIYQTFFLENVAKARTQNFYDFPGNYLLLIYQFQKILRTFLKCADRHLHVLCRWKNPRDLNFFEFRTLN